MYVFLPFQLAVSDLNSTYFVDGNGRPVVRHLRKTVREPYHLVFTMYAFLQLV